MQGGQWSGQCLNNQVKHVSEIKSQCSLCWGALAAAFLTYFNDLTTSWHQSAHRWPSIKRTLPLVHALMESQPYNRTWTVQKITTTCTLGSLTRYHLTWGKSNFISVADVCLHLPLYFCFCFIHSLIHLSDNLFTKDAHLRPWQVFTNIAKIIFPPLW